MKQKILIASEYFYPHWTGISKSILQMAKDLTRRNCEVAVLTTRFDNKLKSSESISGINIIRSPYLFRFSRTHYSAASIVDFVKLCRPVSCVIVNSPNSNIAFFSTIAKLLRKRLVIFHQGDLVLPRKTGNALINWLIERIFDVATAWSFLLADSISTYTKDYAVHSRVMRPFIKKFIAYIPPLTINDGAADKRLQNLLAKLKKDQVLIGFAGRFVEEKGFDILLQAIPYVVKKIPNARFVFAGETQLPYENFYGKMKNLIEKNQKYLVFLGRLNQADLGEFYHSLSVFVLPSRSDCFAQTQAEAMWAGVPVVAADIPGARVLVRETGFGKVVSSENPTALSQGIIDVIRNHTHYKQHKNAITPFLKKYNDVSALI